MNLLMDDGLPPLREVIEACGLSARKALGQNFLLDLNLTRRIARAAAPLEGFSVLEVGPGPGGLTRALLAEGASQVIAVERDQRALPALHQIAAHYPDRLQIIEGDALEQNWHVLAKGPTKIVANLPYNIATPLVVGWLTQVGWPPFFSSLTLMFQKEVAERLAAKSGSENYGRLSVLAQARCTAKKQFDVNRSAFTPPPKVTSSIVQLVPREAGDIPIKALERVTAAAFGQRRKMLRSSLTHVFAEAERTLEALGIAPTARAEDLTVAQFVELASALEMLRQ
jgi:16S rRNA (adenine1518-N6/adenine1519-N6)-dimethyltransferase